jgi:hypothetical protein
MMRLGQPLFANPAARHGVMHYEAVRFVLNGLTSIPREARTIERARALQTDFFQRRGVKVKGASLISQFQSGDPEVELRRARLNPALAAAVTSAFALSEQELPIDEFNANLSDLNRLATTRLKGKDRDAFYLFTATLAEGYRFWSPRRDGGAGGMELLLAVRGQGDELVPPRGEARAWKAFWREFLKYTRIDASASLLAFNQGWQDAIISGAAASIGAGLSTGP